MALVLADRVRETTTVTGTGTATLLGAVSGYQSFSAVGNANTTYYVIANQSASEWEVGIGTYTASGTLLSRDTVLASSNGGSLVNFSAGTKDVFVDYPAGRAVYEDAAGNVDGYPITGGTINNTTIGATTPSTGVFTTLTATGQTSLGTGSTRFWTATGASTTPTFIASGNNAIFGVAGTGTTFIQSSTSTSQLAVSHTASAVNYVQVTGGATGVTPAISFQGSDGNIGGSFVAKGSNGTFRFLTNTTLEQLRILNTASAVNYATITGSAASSGPIFSANGSDTNIDLNLTTKGTGAVNLNTGNGLALKVADAGVGTIENYWRIEGRNISGSPTMYVEGAGTNINSIFTTKGAGSHNFTSGGSRSNTQLAVAHTASAVNYVQVTGAATGVRPTISAQGSDTNAGINIVTKGSAGIFLGANAGNSYLATFAHSTSAVNYLQITNSATAVAPTLTAQGSDTNIPLVLQPKGTGALQAQQTDSTATGGNARGANAVDWQTSRIGATQVASGQYATIGGGYRGTASGFATTISGGEANTSSGFISTVGGGAYNTSSGSYAVIAGGYLNTISKDWSFLGAGYGNTAGGFHNFVGSGYSNSGTSASAVTTQSATMNGTTAVTLSGSNASIKVGQLVSGTSINNFPNTYVAAISGTSLTLSQAASGSSTSTLSFFTPHGVVVGGGNNQATGSYSFIGGGGDAGTAANRNVASGAWSTVAGGVKNVASGVSSFVGGGGTDGAGTYYSNTASGISSVISGGWNNNNSGSYGVIAGGQSNTVSNSIATIAGGTNNYADGFGSAIVGGTYGTTRAISGNIVFPASVSPISSSIYGASQAALLVLGVQTTDATATVLRSNTSAAGTANQVILPNNSAYYFKGSVIANVTGGGNTKGWTIEGAIKRGANAASTALVGTPTVTSGYADAGASTWAITATADTTNGGLAITFTGQASTTIRVVAKLETTEVTF